MPISTHQFSRDRSIAFARSDLHRQMLKDFDNPSIASTNQSPEEERRANTHCMRGGKAVLDLHALRDAGNSQV